MFNLFKKSSCNHRFEARYDEREIRSGIDLKGSVRPMTAEELKSLFVLKVYIYDICIKCGEVINKK